MKRIRVSMTPHPDEMKGKEHSGIAQVVINWAKHLPEFGVDIVQPGLPADISVGHVTSNKFADIHVSHGLLWTEEMDLGGYAYQVNADLVECATRARQIIVPSQWVADVYRRDFRKDVRVIDHGVNIDEWAHNRENKGYVLYAKNRTSDGLNPSQINDVARALPNVEFRTTFATRDSPPNVNTYGGTVPFLEMQRHIQEAGVLFMPDRETWGIAAAEALAAGVPVCTTDAGAVKQFVIHGKTGYVYEKMNLADAVQGIKYCLEHNKLLGANGLAYAKKQLRWDDSAERVASVIRDVHEEMIIEKQLDKADKLHTVSVVITSKNYGHRVGDAIESAMAQTVMPDEIIVVDDGSTDNTKEVVKKFTDNRDPVKYMYVDYGNVANARNEGFYNATSRYIVSLDGDDQIKPDFIRDCRKILINDPLISFSYSHAEVHILETGEILVPPQLEKETGYRRHRDWPTEDFDKQFIYGHGNQLPSCAMFRAKDFYEMGGYRTRYAPDGAGSEDANLFLRLLAHGRRGKMTDVTERNLWIHTHGEGFVSGTDGYEEVDWRAWAPYTTDFRFPFPAIATPKNVSHPVRSYEPEISVIIPVGPGHEKYLAQAIDSVEAQHNRKWEVIVVWDTQPSGRTWNYIHTTYPHVNMLYSYDDKYQPQGPGLARNIGVEAARAQYVTFLDVDDYLGPDFLSYVNPETSKKYNAVIYSEYYSVMANESQPSYGGHIIKKGSKNTIVSYNFKSFDREKAMARPEGDRPYVWSGVNVLLPKAWHESIGGFDEEIDSWEDCLYLLELSWKGYEFRRVNEPLWTYSFLNGTRRENSTGKEAELISYFQEKYDAL
jgi:glycosyltransferase involved in cell wall biosynthesis